MEWERHTAMGRVIYGSPTYKSLGDFPHLVNRRRKSSFKLKREREGEGRKEGRIDNKGGHEKREQRQPRSKRTNME
jgi:hypothetical protein|nr:hypothetical protein Q903MT_gene1604 [Picea sitchensis]